MAQRMLLACASCGELLQGPQGREIVNREHLYIKGRICVEGIRDDSMKGRTAHFFATKSDDEETAVCNVQCLGDWISMRQEQYKKQREKRLRDEASGIVHSYDPRTREVYPSRY